MAKTQEAGTTAGNVTANKLVVTREMFRAKKNAKEYYAYLVKGTLRGREVKADLIPPKAGKETDAAGYEILDIIFAGSETAEIERTYEEYTQDGVKKTRTVYSVWNADTDTGEIFRFNVVPARPSDKAKLDMLLDRAS